MSVYRSRPNLYLGFHGCDVDVLDKLINHPYQIKASKESFDWLGHGFYVWENNYQRAMQWATDKKKRGLLKKPSVVGVVYTLENCLDFSDADFIAMLTTYFSLFKTDLSIAGQELPTNKDFRKDEHKDLIIRELDCAVIEYLHQKIAEKIALETEENGFSKLQPFDTVRGIFTEGGPAFDGAGIQSKNHIQVCIRNLDCVKGFFLPRL